MKYFSLLIPVLLLIFQTEVSSQVIPPQGDHVCTCSHADASAPIGVSWSHGHPKGGWMFSYRVMPMWMKGDLSGSKSISGAEIHQQYMVAPQIMTMQMHMLGVMYAPTNRVTLMTMLNLHQKKMDLATGMGMQFSTQSGGVGDLSLGAILTLVRTENHELLSNVGLSFPTGSINERDDTPMAENVRLAYPMQLGSGTWDPMIGFTYNGFSELFSWGAQSTYMMRAGENKNYYRLGNVLNASAWAAIKATSTLAFSARLNFTNTQEIEGADPQLNPMMMPLFNSVNSGGNQVDLLGGISFHITSGALNGLRLAAETGYPVYQYVTGIQMKRNVIANFGIQYSIGNHCSGCE